MSKKKMGARHFLFPQPAILAGVNVDGKPNWLTIAWCGIMQATPPLIYISLRRERYSLPGITENGTFSVNVPSTAMAPAVDFCGIKSGHKVDKSGIFKAFYGDIETAPMIEDCPINMECKLIQTLDFEGTHIICIGEIVETYVNDDCLDGNMPDIKKVDPLIFSTDGKYWAVGEKVGDAFRIGNAFKPK
jgi:flavin reductase (DIM6/NTAB) family NADH-FMN oxidoreductase RutF